MNEKVTNDAVAFIRAIAEKEIAMLSGQNSQYEEVRLLLLMMLCVTV